MFLAGVTSVVYSSPRVQQIMRNPRNGGHPAVFNLLSDKLLVVLLMYPAALQCSAAHLRGPTP